MLKVAKSILYLMRAVLCVDSTNKGNFTDLQTQGGSIEWVPLTSMT